MGAVIYRRGLILGIALSIGIATGYLQANVAWVVAILMVVVAL